MGPRSICNLAHGHRDAEVLWRDKVLAAMHDDAAVAHKVVLWHFADCSLSLILLFQELYIEKGNNVLATSSV
jgi:hypothetical protein